MIEKRKKFTELINMFTNSKGIEFHMFQIDDLVCFTLDKNTLRDIIERDSDAEVVFLGYDTQQRDKVLREVNIDAIEVGVNMMKNAKKHRDMSLLEQFTVEKVLKDVKRLELNRY